MVDSAFKTLLTDIRACFFCADHLSVPPKPVVQLHPAARILVIAQAPGTRARASGRPFDDASGDRLRAWLGVDRSVFYDETKFAFMPMGFCYPGKSKSGDLPPCPECAPLWHPKITPYLKKIELTLLVGTYAHRFYLKTSSVNQAVAPFREYLPSKLALPHPSWHNINWLRQHPWFEQELIPILQRRVAKILASY